MRWRTTRESDEPSPTDREGGGRPGRFESERWPRTPRVIRWAWAAGMTALVVVGAVGGHNPEARLMIRLMHQLIEALDEQQQPQRDRLNRSDGADQ